jgi:hypothetical protein
MIEQGKQRNALAALNAILVLARHLVRQGQSAGSKRWARLCDCSKGVN